MLSQANKTADAELASSIIPRPTYSCVVVRCGFGAIVFITYVKNNSFPPAILMSGSNKDNTAACERGFSTMKRVKSDWHCTLGTYTIDMLMRVKMEGL